MTYLVKSPAMPRPYHTDDANDAQKRAAQERVALAGTPMAREAGGPEKLVKVITIPDQR